ncbi:hypothetical protein HHK36_000583 [Tetracentron sinense]|uniref:TAFII28-like protein domain-containing protein n=1 Tax=Tetracentron sinense TaxID=13715 RepID=A0A834ZRT8_TETSI|nr:hypothetical protein HHK36_000583 [Tetracentron sinense]
MKQSKDPFEVAFKEDQDDSPPDSPIAPDETEGENPVAPIAVDGQEDSDVNNSTRPTNPSTSFALSTAAGTAAATGKTKEEEEEEEEENMDVEIGKLPSSGDPDKMAKMQAILSRFTEEQMSRYESFRRSGFQKANMKKLLASITGSPKISVPMTIVVSGIAKMFVGELIEADNQSHCLPLSASGSFHLANCRLSPYYIYDWSRHKGVTIGINTVLRRFLIRSRYKPISIFNPTCGDVCQRIVIVMVPQDMLTIIIEAHRRFVSQETCHNMVI